MALLYPLGTVLYVKQVPDKQGRNHKDRHVVLVHDVDDADPTFTGAAVTGTFTHPLPATSVSLPYHRQGKTKTGLNKPSIADCTWIVVATPGDVIKVRGFTPSIQLGTILQQVQADLSPPTPPAGPRGSAGS